MPELTVSATEAGLSPEAFLQQRIPAAPVGYLRKLIKDGKIRLNGVHLQPDGRIAAGDRLTLPESRRLADLLQQSQRLAVAILYETGQFLVVDKPAGLATHAGQKHLHDNLTRRVEELLKNRGQHFMAAPIQRLDLETSGPVLFGKGKKSCSLLGQMMMAGGIAKTYLGLVAGQTEDSGLLVSSIPAKGKIKTAETAYQAIDRSPNATLVHIELRTGRQHQIRRQFSDLGHPLFGDRRYNGPCPVNLHRLFLHCTELIFTDPLSGQPVRTISALPADLSEFIASMGLQLNAQAPQSPTAAARQP